MLTDRQRKRIEDMIRWADIRVTQCREQGRPGPMAHHLAKASALRSALHEIDMCRNEQKPLWPKQSTL